jgi:thiamine-phosphate diphosphorylase
VSVFRTGRGILCLVTHGQRLAAHTDCSGKSIEDLLVRQVSEAASAGVDLVQIREPNLEPRHLYRLVERCLAAAAGRPTRILVNDRADVALTAGAHGVHLRADSYAADRVRAIAPSGFIVGRSVHAQDEAAAAIAGGALDYIIFGTVFASASKPPGHRVAGIQGLAAAVAAARPLPVLAIGGVSTRSAPAIRANGAAGVAAIGLFLPGQVDAEPSLAGTVHRLRSAFDTPERSAENERASRTPPCPTDR